MAKSRNLKLNIVSGMEIERLTVGDLVADVRNHPLFLMTPHSYLQQGRLREVYCSCGQSRLIAESILATGRVQSCGCLRAEKRIGSQMQKIERMKKEAIRAELTMKIKIEQARLKALQSAPIHQRDNKAIDDCAKTLRNLFARKSQINRKKPDPEKLRQAAIDRLIDKDPEG